MKKNIVEPKTLKGFRDFLPSKQKERDIIISSIENVIKSFSYEKIDTPILEFRDILLAKSQGNTTKQIFSFKDAKSRWVALRFDLTVPFARFMAQNSDHDILLPFRRYQIGKVFRGENPQKGRYREFIQFDFDIVGADSFISDFEVISTIYEGFNSLGLSDKLILKVFHREIILEFLNKLDVKNKYNKILNIIDKFEKQTLEESISNLSDILEDDEKVNKILKFINIEGDNNKVLEELEALTSSENIGIIRLKNLLQASNILGYNFIKINPSVVRGLDYYTGLVFESFIMGFEDFGSMCSGGRYDDLINLYSKKELSGIGASFGIDRIHSILEESGAFSLKEDACQVAIFNIEETLAYFYLEIANSLRKEGFRVQVIEKIKKINLQFNYCEKKNIPYAIICGDIEKKNNTLTLKDLEKRESFTLSLQECIEKLKKGLN